MKSDSKWFKAQFREIKCSLRNVAGRMGIEPSALSLSINGKRNIKIQEAVDLARIIGQPLETVAKKLGAI